MKQSLPVLSPPLPFIGYVAEKSPILLFTLESLGISRSQFSQRFSSSFHQLDWDEYDVRKRQLDLLAKFGLSINMKQKIAQNFYLGEKRLLAELCASVDYLSNDQVKQVKAITPYRRRAVGKCQLHYDNKSGWQVNILPNKAFKQPEGKESALSYPRQFSPMEAWILKDKLFQEMLIGVANLVEKVSVPVKSISMVIHQVISIATDLNCGDNAPEGLHQDGADYIVSALLVDSSNIEGGISRITNKRNESSFLIHQLRPGEGLFQSDKGTELWHDVSKIYKKNETKTDVDYGYRSTFGLDIHIET